MTVLARKISRAKWKPDQSLGPDAIAADAITADLRTGGNTLSFWRCRSSQKEDLQRAALALAAAAARPDKIEIVCFEERALISAGLQANETPGNTPVESLREHHVDVVRLDYVRLGEVARLVAAGLQAEGYLRLTEKGVLDILVQAVRAQLLTCEALQPDLQDAVNKHLKATG